MKESLSFTIWTDSPQELEEAAHRARDSMARHAGLYAISYQVKGTRKPQPLKKAYIDAEALEELKKQYTITPTENRRARQ